MTGDVGSGSFSDIRDVISNVCLGSEADVQQTRAGCPLIANTRLSWPGCAMSAVGGKSGLRALAPAITGIDPQETNRPQACNVGFHRGKRTFGQRETQDRV